MEFNTSGFRSPLSAISARSASSEPIWSVISSASPRKSLTALFAEALRSLMACYSFRRFDSKHVQIFQEQFLEFGGVKRFDDVVIGAEKSAPVDVLLAPLGGDDDDGDFPVIRVV